MGMYLLKYVHGTYLRCLAKGPYSVAGSTGGQLVGGGWWVLAYLMRQGKA